MYVRVIVRQSSDLQSLRSYGALQSGDIELFWRKMFFFEKTTPNGKFSQFCSERIYGDTDWHVVCKFREIWPTGNGENRALFTWQKQNFAYLSLSYCADRAQNLPRPARDCVLRAFQISSKSVHFRRSYRLIQTREHRRNAPYRVFPIFGWSLASSRTVTPPVL